MSFVQFKIIDKALKYCMTYIAIKDMNMSCRDWKTQSNNIVVQATEKGISLEVWWSRIERKLQSSLHKKRLDSFIITASNNDYYRSSLYRIQCVNNTISWYLNKLRGKNGPLILLLPFPYPTPIPVRILHV